MAYDGAPSSWITSWSEDGTDINVPIASIGDLTAAEADGTTGDIRKVLYEILEHIKTTNDALDSADQPTKMTISKSSSFSGDNAKHVYRVTFYNEISVQDVADEA